MSFTTPSVRLPTPPLTNPHGRHFAAIFHNAIPIANCSAHGWSRLGYPSIRPNRTRRRSCVEDWYRRADRWVRLRRRRARLTKERVVIELRRLLCPVDFSEPSRRALRHAMALARRCGSQLTVLYVEDAMQTAARAEVSLGAPFWKPPTTRSESFSNRRLLAASRTSE
jgi:hypothetical protein